MDLLNSGLLYLLPLAAVPILLHLLTLHRLKTVELSTFRFLFDSYVQQRRKMRFLEFLIAALRTLFLLFLVLAISRPVVSHWGSLFGSGSGREVILLIDCSASMNARSDGKTSLDRAKDAANKIVKRLARDDRLTLIRVDGKPEEVFSRFSSDAASMEAHIDALKVGPSRANLLGALTPVFSKTSREHTKPIVYLFTDCQTSGWRELGEQGVDQLAPEGTKLVVVNVASRKSVPNVAVIGTAPRRERAVAGLPIRLMPRVANYSPTETAEVTLSVFVDEKEIARHPLTIKPNETVEREVIYTPTEAGSLRGRFEITADSFPDDDRYLFALTVVPQIQVLLVNGNPAADPFDNEALYLRTALSINSPRSPPGVNSTGPAAATPPGAPASALNKDKDFIRSLDVHEIAEPGLNAETLRDMQVVILANCGALNAAQFALLRDFVSAGGGLLIFPGDRVNPDIYNSQFFLVPGALKEKFIEVTFGPPQGDAQKLDVLAHFASIDYAHPVLNVFDDAKARYLTTANVYRRFALKTDPNSTRLWTLAGFSPDDPALVEGRFGEGLVLVSAFPATSKWSNLPLKPEFVPLVLRMVNYAAQRPNLEVPPVVPADGSAEIGVTAAWAPVTVVVTDDATKHSDEVGMQKSGSRLMGAFDHTSRAGYYNVEVKGGRPEQPKTATASFAVNLAPEESRLDVASEDDLHRWLPGVDLTMFDATAEAQQQFGSVGDDHEVWRWLLALTFLIIGVEFMLSTVSGRRIEGDEVTVSERIMSITPGTWVGRMTGSRELAEKK